MDPISGAIKGYRRILCHTDDRKSKVALSLDDSEPARLEEPALDIEEGKLSDLDFVEIEIEANQPPSMVVTDFLSDARKFMEPKQVQEKSQLPSLDQHI